MAYSLKHRVVSWVSQKLFDEVTYTVRNGLNRGLRRRGGLAWMPLEQHSPELEFWKEQRFDGSVVYDIGAFHGLLTMYFARTARHVVAWEPTSRNRQRLNDNISLNRFSNVIVRPYGLSSEPSTAIVNVNPLVPGTASLDRGIVGSGEEETIELRTLDAEQGIEPPDFIKVDVEGFELQVLRGATETLKRRPVLFLEMHGATPEDKRRRVREIVDHLWMIGYRNILHVESRTRITHENTAVAAQGHLFVRAE